MISKPVQCMAIGLMLGVMAGSVCAQVARAPEAAKPSVEIPLDHGGAEPPEEAVVSSVSMGTVVRGAPFAAEATTEFSQTLADGNRIVRTSKARVYRDRSGRTRREQSVLAVGAAALTDSPVVTTITDPVAGVSYALDAARRVAIRLPLMQLAPAKTPAAKPFSADTASSPSAVGTDSGAMANVDKLERSLGRREILGVEVEGHTSIVTLPAGLVGNEQPLKITTQRWFCAELHLTVELTRQDPRFGTSVYRVTRLDRSDPPAQLFVVPNGYTVESPASGSPTERVTAEPREALIYPATPTVQSRN